MIRGLQKQTLWIFTPKSCCFEQVCFVLRPERCREMPKEAEILREARSILLQAEPPKGVPCPTPKPKSKSWIWVFAGGVLCGILGTIFGALALGVA